jgi:uncharacterized protein YbjT (DUF2867 family)
MILLCGGTGELGSRVARRLASHGAPLRLLARPGVRPDVDAEVIHGDLRDPASLEHAVRGATTVVSTVTVMSRALAGQELRVRDVDGLGHLSSRGWPPRRIHRPSSSSAGRTR